MANFDNIIQEINTNLPDNNTQAITAAKLRTTLIDLTNTIDQEQDNFETEINNTIASSIVDNLNSTDTDKSLAANQGKVLKEDGNTLVIVGTDIYAYDLIKCIANHKYRMYLDDPTVEISTESVTSTTIIFVIRNYNYDLSTNVQLYKRTGIDTNTPLRSYYDVIPVYNGFLSVGARLAEGEVLRIKVEDITQSFPEYIQTYTNISGYVNTSGTISSSSSAYHAKFNVQGYDYVRFLGLKFNTKPSTAYCFYDENNNPIHLENYEYDTALSSSQVKEYIVQIPNGAYYFKCTVQLSYTYDYQKLFNASFYCYLGKYETKKTDVSREINVSSELSGLVLFPGSINTSGSDDKKWNSVGNHYLIPLNSEDKYMKIKANATNSSYWCFLTSSSDLVGSFGSFASGISKNSELTAGSELELIIPYDAKYLYIQDTPTSTRTPQILIISKGTHNTFEGVDMIPTNIQGGYIGRDYNVVSNDNYFIGTYDVSNVDVVGVHGRLANIGVNVFYDASNNVITHFKGRYSTVSTEFNFNDVINVPEGAKTLKIGFAYNKGFSVMNCTNISKEEPRNLLTCKKVSFLGDSITAGTGSSTGTSTEGYRWTSMFSRYYARCVENNLGNPGTCLCTATKNGRESERFITRVSSETIGDSDVIFIWGGTNDFSYDIDAIGDLFAEETITSNNYIGTKKRVAPTNTDAFPGALHELLSTVRTLNPTAKVIYLTIMNRGKWNSGAYSNKRPSSFEQNANGDWITDYNEAIHKICEFYAVPVIDINSLLNQNWAYDDSTSSPQILQSMDDDGIHPNNAGHKRIAEIVFNYVINNRLV